MKTGYFGLGIRAVAATAGLLLAAFAPSGWAQGVATLSGTTTNSCSYTTITTQSNGNVTVSCSVTATTTATLTFGSVIGSLSTGANSNATLPVNCAGACGGVAASLAVTTTNVSLGTPTVSFTAAGTQNVIVNGTAPLTAGSAPVTLTVTSIGSATSSTPALNGTMTANVPIVDSAAPGTLAFSPALASVTEGGAAVTVSVTRAASGSSAIDVSVAYSCAVLPTTYTPTFAPDVTGSGTLSWVGPDTTVKTFTINPTTVPGTTAGTVTCTLGATTGGATASTTAYVLTVNKTGTATSCSTQADKTFDLSTGSVWRITGLSLGPNQTGAVKIKPSIGTYTTFLLSTTWPVPSTFAPAGVQFNISDCPGDFTRTLATYCGPYYKTSNRTDKFSSTNTSPGYCMTPDPTKTYYYNIRFVSPSTGLSTCSAASCAVNVDLSPQTP
jgi:hypothetical protein